jgi:site-specific DNA recombinase
MLISKITISKTREIKSIELNINDNLLMYLSNGGEPSPDGGGYPFSVVSRRMMIINPVNIIIVLIRIYKYVDKKGFKKYI